MVEQVLCACHDPNAINAVIVLSDGKDEHDNYSETGGIGGLVEYLKLADVGPEHLVRVFPIAYGTAAKQSTDNSPVSDLQRIAEASHGRVFDAETISNIEAVLGEVLSTF